MSQAFSAHELDYELPEASIAQSPLAERDAAKLLCMPKANGARRSSRAGAGARGSSRAGAATSALSHQHAHALSHQHAHALSHQHVRDLPRLLPPSLLVLNDTRVIPARLFGHKPTGGRVEILLVERMADAGSRERWRAMGRASKGLRPGDRIAIADGTLSAHVLTASSGASATFELDLSVVGEAHASASLAVDRLGVMPLPPYIRREPEDAQTDALNDAERYQTVFAAHPGAVAAPTAGLHFTPELLHALQAAGHELAYVTLHVGPGTFAPLRSDDLSEHTMHEERYEVPQATSDAIASAREQGRQVLAVGTTVVRTLESAATVTGHVPAGSSATSIFIYPPHPFRVVDALLTNFHLPRSTLLALVMALGGVDAIRSAYRSAIDAGYRFYSYGDAMLIGGLASGLTDSPMRYVGERA